MSIMIRKTLSRCRICGCKSKVFEHLGAPGGSGTWFICPGAMRFPTVHESLDGRKNTLESWLGRKKELEKEIAEIRKVFRGIKPLEKTTREKQEGRVDV